MARIVIGYPPIENKKGIVRLSQNRQLQFLQTPCFIYPMVPAYAATMLKNVGHEVYWLDGIAEKKTYEQWKNELFNINPDYLILESKAPVIKFHWKVIDQLKKILPDTKTILVGDHVTAFPEESLKNSKVDYVVTGGDYDFGIVELINKTKLNHNLDELPFIDRELTKWQLYAFENGNYKYTPGTYMYSGRDCWWGKCSFCVWNHTLNPCGTYRQFSAKRLFAEVKDIVDKYYIKEIFDDAGTFMAGKPFQDFCRLMIDSGYNKKIRFGINMRFCILKKEDYQLMAEAGFKMILYGLESANQETLNKINKGIDIGKIKTELYIAKKAGLEPHITAMIGYPWENYQDAQNTVKFMRNLLKEDLIDSLQVTTIMPYPGTPLWRESQKKKWLLTENYDDYDMSRSVLKSPLTEKQIAQLLKQAFAPPFYPKFIWGKMMGLRNLEDLKEIVISAKKLFTYWFNFWRKEKWGK